MSTEEQQYEHQVITLAKNLTITQRRNFKKDLANSDKAIQDDWKETANLGYGKNMSQKLNTRIASWALKGFKAPIFQEVISYKEAKRKGTRNLSVGWRRMCAIFGTQENATMAFNEGEIVCVPQANGPDLYRTNEQYNDHGSSIQGEKVLTGIP